VRPGTGEILAVSSNAAADPGNALRGQFPPGSSMKTITATALLGANPQLAGIIAYNDPSAAGAAAAARIAGRHISIVGMNGDDFGVQGVKKGTITATFQNDAVGQGVQGVIGAYDVLAGIKVPKAIVRPPSAAITASTVKGVKSWSQQLAELERSGD